MVHSEPKAQITWWSSPHPSGELETVCTVTKLSTCHFSVFLLSLSIARLTGGNFACHRYLTTAQFSSCSTIAYRLQLHSKQHLCLPYGLGSSTVSFNAHSLDTTIYSTELAWVVFFILRMHYFNYPLWIWNAHTVCSISAQCARFSCSSKPNVADFLMQQMPFRSTGSHTWIQTFRICTAYCILQN